MNAAPAFQSLETQDAERGGLYIAVGLDRDCVDFSHLIGRSVFVDGALIYCRGVEAGARLGPHHKGDTIRLWVT